MGELLKYNLGDGAKAFTAGRGCPLPLPVIQGHQVHGKKIAIIDRPDFTREDLEGYDAFITSLKGVAIGVRTADCVPVLIYNPVAKVVAAVHSGWRGTVQRIAKEAIELMGKEFGCKPGDLRAVIGPAIGPDSFQVGQEVADRFLVEGFPMDKILSIRGEGDGSPMSGGLHIDLIEANRWILKQSGVPAENINDSGIDTYTDSRFYSARREGLHCGRNINAILLTR